MLEFVNILPRNPNVIWIPGYLIIWNKKEINVFSTEEMRWVEVWNSHLDIVDIRVLEGDCYILTKYSLIQCRLPTLSPINSKIFNVVYPKSRIYDTHTFITLRDSKLYHYINQWERQYIPTQTNITKYLLSDNNRIYYVGKYGGIYCGSIYISNIKYIPTLLKVNCNTVWWIYGYLIHNSLGEKFDFTYPLDFDVYGNNLAVICEERLWFNNECFNLTGSKVKFSPDGSQICVIGNEKITFLDVGLL